MIVDMMTSDLNHSDDGSVDKGLQMLSGTRANKEKDKQEAKVRVRP
jgi:hypothetical protein